MRHKECFWTRDRRREGEGGERAESGRTALKFRKEEFFRIPLRGFLKFKGSKRSVVKEKIEEVFIGKEIKPFLVSMFLFAFAFGIFGAVLNNYLANILSVDEAGRGVVEFFREIPGLLLVFLLALLYKRSERGILFTALASAGIGVLGILFFGSHLVVTVIFLVIWSVGEHLLMPVRRSYTVHLAKDGKGGEAMGLIGSLESLATFLGLCFTILIFYLGNNLGNNFGNRFFGGSVEELDLFHLTFIAVTLLILIAIFFISAIPRSHKPVQRMRIHFQKKYTKYYILEMFYGARKQVFITFGPYVLVLIYGVTVEEMAALLAITALSSTFITPLMGKLMDKVGYRNIMIYDTVILFFVCLVYGFAGLLFSPRVALIVLCINFILDRIISRASMASSLYVKSLANDKEEATSTIASGITINHVISIAVALAGGWIWQIWGIQWLFSLSALMALGNSIFAYTIEKPTKS